MALAGRSTSTGLAARQSDGLAHDPTTCPDACCGCPCSAQCLKVTLTDWPNGEGLVDGDWFLKWRGTVGQDSNGNRICVFSTSCVIDVLYGGFHYSSLTIGVALTQKVDGTLSIIQTAFGVTSDDGGPEITFFDNSAWDAPAPGCDQSITVTTDDGSAVFSIVDEIDCDTCTNECSTCCPDVICATLRWDQGGGDFVDLTFTRNVTSDTCEFWAFCPAIGSAAFGWIGHFVIHCDVDGNPSLVFMQLQSWIVSGGNLIFSASYHATVPVTISCDGDTTIAIKHADGSSAGSATLTLKTHCDDDTDCDYHDDNGCSVDCIGCDDCPPFCPDDGATFLSLNLQFDSGQCSDDCTFNDPIFGGGCGYCVADADCANCTGDAEHDPACILFNIDNKIDCVGAGHVWCCDEACMVANGDGTVSPCSSISLTGAFDLPLVSHTSTTMTFELSFSIGGRAWVLNVVFDCAAKSYVFTITIDSRCVATATVSGVDASCDGYFALVNLELIDTTTGAVCNNQDVTIDTVRIHRLKCAA